MLREIGHIPGPELEFVEDRESYICPCCRAGSKRDHTRGKTLSLTHYYTFVNARLDLVDHNFYELDQGLVLVSHGPSAVRYPPSYIVLNHTQLQWGQSLPLAQTTPV